MTIYIVCVVLFLLVCLFVYRDYGAQIRYAVTLSIAYCIFAYNKLVVAYSAVAGVLRAMVQWCRKFGSAAFVAGRALLSALKKMR